jgi:enoyl-CoA hydratase
MGYEVIRFEVENSVAVITLNRPPMNPLNNQAFQDLANAAYELEANPTVKAVIITGAGDRAFSAGADIKEMALLTPVELYTFCQASLTAFTRLENLGKPVIAAVNGLALGGGTELALSCDFRIAADNAKFAQPEINLGMMPGAGGTQRLPRLIGASKAKELVFLGEMIDASTAERLGLVNQVVPAASLMEAARALASKLATKPAVALKMAKEAVNTGLNMDIHSALTLEIQHFITSFSSADAREGLRAFLEKRKPHFTDH